jgi:phosphate transport system permease protein
MHRLRARQAWSGALLGAGVVATVLALVPLIAILGFLVAAGWRALDLSLFTALPPAVGMAGGGLGNGVVGSLVLVTLTALIAIPLGIGGGLFTFEYRGHRSAQALEFLADLLNGVPSIVLGVIAWAVVVRPMGRFSAIAGAIALALVAVPLLVRATTDVLALVPRSVWEAGLALGYTRARTAFRIVLPTARAGIRSAVIVTMARVAGETAPLLFTAFGSSYWLSSPLGPTAALPLQVYVMALSPFDRWRELAAAGALLLVVGVAGAAAIARLAARPPVQPT